MSVTRAAVATLGAALLLSACGSNPGTSLPSLVPVWQRNGTAPPSLIVERFDMPLAYASADSRFIGFGGAHDAAAQALAGETWAFSTRDISWREQVVLGAPPRRHRHCTTYLPNQNEVLLVGGREESGQIRAIAWTYQVATRSFEQIVGEIPITGFGCVLEWLPDGTEGVAIFFGGAGKSGVGAETWSYDPLKRRFTQLSPSTPPPARLDAMSALDAERKRILVFGGATAEGDDAPVLDDLWAFDGTTWTALAPGTPSPSARRAGASGFDPEFSRWVLFGGRTTTDELSDLWVFSAVQGVWIALEAKPALAPTARSYSASGYDPKERELLLFGGRDGRAKSVYGDGWRLTWRTD